MGLDRFSTNDRREIEAAPRKDFKEVTQSIPNFVQYQSDTFDLSQYGVTPGVTSPAAVLASRANFSYGVGLGDIVAVNGQPAKGPYVIYSRDIAVSPNAMPGKAIGDVMRDAMRPEVFEILNASEIPSGALWFWDYRLDRLRQARPSPKPE